jgi:hypothetical protein
MSIGISQSQILAMFARQGTSGGGCGFLLRVHHYYFGLRYSLLKFLGRSPKAPPGAIMVAVVAHELARRDIKKKKKNTRPYFSFIGLSV